jgi:S1-C subfamily serine protease
VNGYGVPHQLKDLGVASVTSLVPVSADATCELVGTDYADVIFSLPPAGKSPIRQRPRLGVVLAQGDGAPRISQVAKDSVADITGLKAGDHIVRAAGLEMKVPDDLVEVIGQQAPGTWLPLSIRREGEEFDLIAKFPTIPKQNP